MLKKLSVVMVLFAALALTATSGFAAGYRLAGKDASNYVIRLCADPIPAEVHAADELQRFLQEITGVKLPIQQAGTLPRSAILVGRDAVCDRLVPKVDWAKLGGEGFVVATNGSRLVLAGGRPRGTLYAVYSFLQQELGCRWLTPDTSYIPPQDPLIIPDLYRTFVPKLEYREICAWPAYNFDWAARNFVNGQNQRAQHLKDEKRGGTVMYAGEYFVHTFYMLLLPEKNFASHPQWYTWRPSTDPGYGMKYDPVLGVVPGTPGVDYVREVSGGIQGERYFQKTNSLPGQLCLTNPEVVAAVTERVRQWLREIPYATIVSVSQNDGGDNCLCDSCRRSDAEEGSPSGTLIRFVNQIAVNIQSDFPGAAIDTLAYSYTQKPPAKVRPLPNVIVRLATGGCCHTHPYATCPESAQFVAKISSWSAICRRLYIWDYVNNIDHYLVPQPDLDTLGPNIRFFVDHNVKGVFSQGAYTSGGGEMCELRSYMIARSLWDPDSDADQARDEFLNLYYGPAAPPIRDYLLMLQDKVWSDTIHTGPFPGTDSPYLTPEIVSRAWELFDEADRLATGRPEIGKRVRTARLPIQYVVLMRGPEWDARGVPRTTATGSVKWVNKDLVEQFLEAAKEAQIVQLSELVPFTRFRDKLIEQYGIGPR